MRRLVATPLASGIRGNVTIEFAIVAPVMILFLVGGFDTAHTLWMQSAVSGIVQKTGRDSSLETGTETAQQQATDNKVREQVLLLADNADPTFSRRFYRTFSLALAARREDFTDTDKDGTCDNNEPYVDANDNKTWDADGADAGQGGAKDKTVYKVTVTYPRMLPLHRFIPGLPATQTVTASTVLQNQPYSDQSRYANTTTIRNCP